MHSSSTKRCTESMKDEFLTSVLFSVTFETQTLKNSDVGIFELAKSNRVEYGLPNLCEPLMNCKVKIRILRFPLLSKVSLPYSSALGKSATLF